MFVLEFFDWPFFPFCNLQNHEKEKAICIAADSDTPL
jgi:hypothetical protein